MYNESIPPCSYKMFSPVDSMVGLQTKPYGATISTDQNVTMAKL